MEKRASVTWAALASIHCVGSGESDSFLHVSVCVCVCVCVAHFSICGCLCCVRCSLRFALEFGRVHGRCLHQKSRYGFLQLCLYLFLCALHAMRATMVEIVHSRLRRTFLRILY